MAQSKNSIESLIEFVSKTKGDSSQQGHPNLGMWSQRMDDDSFIGGDKFTVLHINKDGYAKIIHRLV